MDIEEIKEYRDHAEQYLLGEVVCNIVKQFDWLIAEVDRLQLIVSGKTFYNIEALTAQRCAELAETYRVFRDVDYELIEVTPTQHKIAEAIREEYGLEK